MTGGSMRAAPEHMGTRSSAAGWARVDPAMCPAVFLGSRNHRLSFPRRRGPRAVLTHGLRVQPWVGSGGNDMLPRRACDLAPSVKPGVQGVPPEKNCFHQPTRAHTAQPRGPTGRALGMGLPDQPRAGGRGSTVFRPLVYLYAGQLLGGAGMGGDDGVRNQRQKGVN